MGLGVALLVHLVRTTQRYGPADNQPESLTGRASTTPALRHFSNRPS